MQNNQFSKEVSSFVSCALRVQPSRVFAGQYANEVDVLEESMEEINFLSDREFASMQLQSDKLSAREFASIEVLLDKYKVLKNYLSQQATLDDLEVVASDHIKPKDEQRPEIEYKTVAVNAAQLEIAKFVAKKVEEIHSLYVNGEHYLAKTSYNTLQEFLAEKRSSFIGDFRSIQELEDGLGMHAVGTNGNPQAAAPLIAFIIIEIYLG